MIEYIKNVFDLSQPHLQGSWPWVIFAVLVVTLLYLDLFILHKKNEEPQIPRTLKICAAYISIALLFGLFVLWCRGSETAMLFYTGYLVEFSLSLDNIFVMSIIFSSLSIPTKYQHRVLFWGILGAVLMRAVMILIGSSLVDNFQWLLYVFSIFLIYTGVQMFFHEEQSRTVTEGRLYKFVEKRFNMTKTIENEHFIVKKGGKTYITPLLFALIIIEAMDVVFAVDSIPAIFLITQDLFVVYTSNIFAILGLRSLYFLLAAAVNKFSYLKPALAIILIFIGTKIFTPFLGFEIEEGASLAFTFCMIFGGIILSLVRPPKEA